MILSGNTVASHILAGIKNEITYSGYATKPMLAVVLVGDNPASRSYIRMKEKRAREIGMAFGVYTYPVDISQQDLEKEVHTLCENEHIHGVIVQAPLPTHIDRYAVTECIVDTKDVDGFTRTQIGNMYLGHDGLYSCTPRGIMSLLEYYDISVLGRRVCVIGRSNIVGKPMSLLLINAGATVISCNSRTENLADITRDADIVICAVGQPKFLTQDMLTEKSIVIDVGCTYIDGVVYGDADYENLKDYVRAISPVPGGVGPMTVSTLLSNTYKAYRDNCKL